MTRGLYTAYTGMYNEQKRLDIISNNLANSATIGYKEEQVTSQAFKEMLTYKIRDRSNGFVDEPIGKMSLGVKIGETYTDYTQGSFKVTGNTLDLALEGTGFFNIEYASKSGIHTILRFREVAFLRFAQLMPKGKIRPITPGMAALPRREMDLLLTVMAIICRERGETFRFLRMLLRS